MTKYERVMRFVLRWEGGARVTRDSSDPGGTTKYGISQRAHPTVDVPNLTEKEARAIYRDKYWSPLECGAMPWPQCLVVMDYAVHSGVKTVRSVRHALTQLAHVRNPRERAYRLNAYRMGFLLRIAKRRKASRKYVRGWMNRVHAIFEELEKE